MPKWKISEKTAALLPSLIAQAGITNPIVGVDETETMVRIYILASPQPVIVRKPKPPVKKAKAKPTTKPASTQTRGKKKP